MDDERFKLDEYEAKLLVRMPAFQKGILAMRKHWRIPTNGFADNKAGNEWREHITANDMDALKEAVRALTTKLEYSERWLDGVLMYLQTNDKFMLRAQSPYEVRFKFSRKDPKGDDRRSNRKDASDVWIRVYADTTEREVCAALKETKEMFELKYRKKQLYEYADRDIAALDRHEEGMSNADISDWLADNGYGHYTANDVAKYLRHIKRRLKY